MPLFISALLGGLLSFAGTMVGRVLISLGYTYIVFQGVLPSIEVFREHANTLMGQAGNISPVIMQIAGVLQIGTCLTMLFNAMVSRVAMQATFGAIKKMTLK
ncbi:MAG: DUF2523 domain-containing protein [Pseudomonadota bacterium]